MAAASWDLDAYLAAERARVERTLAAAAAEVAGAAPEPLGAALRYALATPGKRLRPILCAAAYRVAAGRAPAEAVYRLGVAVELVHTYSLVHDDLPCMDDDALRRGRPTVHVAFSPRAALLAGAAMIPASLALLDRAAVELGVDDGTRGALAAELCRAAGAEGMVGGQWLDLEAERTGAATGAAALEAIHRRKTGALLAASLRVGALAGGAQGATLEALTEYGAELGLAFQIVDDLLDVTRTDQELGKTAGKDAGAGKATYPALHGVAGARALAAERVRRAVAALRGGGIDAPPLEALAAYVLERRR